MAPNRAVVRMDSRMPKWVSAQTMANVISAKIHQGMFTPAASWNVVDAR